MQNGKDKPPSHSSHVVILILLLLSLVVAASATIKPPSPYGGYKEGDTARENIKSPSDIYLPERGISLKKGEIVILEGERINGEHARTLVLFEEIERGAVPPVLRFVTIFAILFLSMKILYEYARRGIRKFGISVKDLLFSSALISMTVIPVKLVTLVFSLYAPNHAASLFYMIPIFSFGIIIRIVLFSEAAIIFSLILSIAVALIFENSFPLFLYTLLGSLLASYFSGKSENRNAVLKAGLFTALASCAIVFLIDLFLGNPPLNIPLKMAFILVNGIGSSFIALGLLPVIEQVFDYTTDVRLLEIANLDHPLLEEMMLRAPGTHHHSIVVGNLSKAAAESIGAHPLLARVSSYYHDIGKLKMPHYFIENRIGFEDAHKDLTPNMSALIILAHVKEGVELAEQHKLGKKIKDIIREHHGTSLVSYFYNRARDIEDPQMHVIEEKDFRYHGPKPQTREAAIVMLADAVEASSRVLDDPTPKRIEGHVQDIIGNIFLDGQLDECELTLKDLHAIQKSFIAILIGIFHQRIEYPERVEHDGAHKRLPKIPSNGQKADKKDRRRLADIFKADR